MEGSGLLEKNKSWAAFALLAFRRYFLYSRKAFQPSGLRLFCCLQLAQSLQSLSLLIPNDPNLGLPWNYSLTAWLWTALELTVRPDSVLVQLGMSSSAVVMIYGVLLAGKAALALVLAWGLAVIKEETYEGLHGNSDRKMWIKGILAVDYYWGVAVLRLLGTTLPAYLISHLASPGSTLFCLLFLVLKVLDAAYFASTSWFSSDLDAVSSPTIQVSIWLVDLAFIIFVSGFPFRTFPTQFACVLMALGGYKLAILLRVAPFHSAYRTAFELAKGLIVGWGGLCLLLGIALGVSQSSVLTLVLFFVPFPLLVGICIHLLHLRMRSLCRVKYPQRLYEVEQILRREIHKGHGTSSRVDQAFTKACQIFPRSEQLVIWALYYYRSLKDVTFVQVNISKLMKMKWSIVSYIECFACYKGVMDWLRTLPDQAEPISFWEYQVRLEKVLRKDREITKIHCELFSELAMEHPRAEKVIKLGRSIVRQITEFEAFVKRTMARHAICPELLLLYSDFLSVLTNSKRAKKYEVLASRVTEQLKAHKNEGSVDLYDSKCMIVVMSLERATLGSVIWARNCDILGYSDRDIIGSDHCIIIPMPLKHSHSGMLKRITMFRHHHPVYESRHHLYFAHKSGLLIGAHWKVRLINLPANGDMTIVAALKPRADAAAVAFIDESGTRVTAMVETM